MKKPGAAAILAFLPALASFGADFDIRAGGGVFLGGLFTRYNLSARGAIGVPVDIVSEQEMNQFKYGGYLFFDAPWTEASVSLQGGIGTYREDMSAESSGQGEVFGSTDKGAGTEMMLGFSLLGKYPFRLNRQFTLFPLAGVEYQIALMERRDPEGPRRGYDRTDGIRESDSNGSAYRLSAWNSLFIDIGAGLDFTVNPRMFLRAEFLYAFRLMTPYESDALEKVKKMAGAQDPKLAGLTSGPVLRVGLGYML
ncbi:MAG: autotransporter outer membrane beta-barrel domain-containing protein [Treponema sp.]|jgi:opacity protein-like surface antigen|nr:autotransporter outer membrane beta-barrel domain-containing protein [Treponema sp.]